MPSVDTLYSFLRVQEEGLAPIVAGPEARRYQMVLHEIPATGWDITPELEGYTRVQAGLNRFSNTPSYAFPWHGDGIPVPFPS
jgi:hypothetical protein